MKPTFSNLKKLVLKNCNRKNCKMFQLNEGRLTSDKRCRNIDYINNMLCDNLKIKFREWNSLFFPNRPCDVCLVKPMCIDGERHITSKILTCDLFVKYKNDLLHRYKRGNTEVLLPELSFYSDRIVVFLDQHWFR